MLDSGNLLLILLAAAWILSILENRYYRRTLSRHQKQLKRQITMLRDYERCVSLQASVIEAQREKLEAKEKHIDLLSRTIQGTKNQSPLHRRVRMN